MKKFTIYSKTYCPYCENAKDLITNKGDEYREYILDKDFEASEFLEKFDGWRTFPAILEGDTFIGGFKELRDYYNKEMLGDIGI